MTTSPGSPSSPGVSPLSYARQCAEIVAQAELLASRIAAADLTVPVPSCPGWNVGQLVRHLGGGQRWAEEMVRTRATEPASDAFFRDLAPYAHEDPTVLTPWLREGAEQLADTLRAAGPEAALWTPVPGGTAAFYARRFTHETAIHRADAILALGERYTLDEAVAVDAFDEWLELGSLPRHFEVDPRMRELLGPGRTLHLHATDIAPEAGAEWVVDLTGDVITWRRGHEKCAVAVRGPLVELLLLVYRRRPAGNRTFEILGDAGLLGFWLDRVGFG
ncbi:maleylpyruvate isomerase family mycothiol-dependent enzyme [Actinomycetota bacterium Odt1-20B]